MAKRRTCTWKKTRRILIELTGSPSDRFDVVIGLSINTHLAAHKSREVNQPWIDLASLYGCNHFIDRTEIICQLVQQLRTDLSMYNSRGFLAFVDDWNQWDYFYQKPVVLLQNENKIEAIAQGVNAQGGLLLQTSSKERLEIYSGSIVNKIPTLGHDTQTLTHLQTMGVIN